MDSIYREQILEHYKHPCHYGHIENPQCAHCGENATCGDRLCFEANCTEDNVVSEVAFHGQGCAISQAAASMLADKVIKQKMTVAQILALKKEDVIELLGISLSPVRLKCALLGLEVLQNSVAKKLSRSS